MKRKEVGGREAGEENIEHRTEEEESEARDIFSSVRRWMFDVRIFLGYLGISSFVIGPGLG